MIKRPVKPTDRPSSPRFKTRTASSRLSRPPVRRMRSGCCARAVSGHSAAAALSPKRCQVCIHKDLSTFCFAVDRDHARQLKEQFEAAGAPSAYMLPGTKRRRAGRIAGTQENRRGQAVSRQGIPRSRSHASVARCFGSLAQVNFAAITICAASDHFKCCNVKIRTRSITGGARQHHIQNYSLNLPDVLHECRCLSSREAGAARRVNAQRPPDHQCERAHQWLIPAYDSSI